MFCGYSFSTMKKLYVIECGGRAWDDRFVHAQDLPWNEWKPFRSIKIDGEELEFSTGFTELHNISYEEILKGNGFTLNDVEPTIKLIEKIRK